MRLYLFDGANAGAAFPMEIRVNAKEEDKEIGCEAFQGDGAREGQIQASVSRSPASCEVGQEKATSRARRRALQE